MESSDLVQKTANMIRDKFLNEGSGHDWWHIWRVWQIAKRIAIEEKADSVVVEFGSLLHDIADWKENNGDTKAGGKASREWLRGLGVDEVLIEQVSNIVDNVSYKGAGVEDKMDTLEGKIVQDADRLDAMGAIGIGRVFAYGGYKGRAIYDPDVAVNIAKDFEEYKSAGQTSINHFYEKLLLLKDRMHTEAGKKMAEGRHIFMQKFLDEFYVEWKGEQ